MPVYEYECLKCGKRFERIESIQAHGARKPRCAHCKSTRVRQRLGSFFAKTSKKS